MSNKRYLEIDSSYRNRNEFPNPAKFDVLLSQSGSREATYAFDPVSNNSPIKLWKPDDLVLSNGIVDPPSSPLNTKNSFIISFPTISNASKISDYYSGYPISVSTPSITEFVRIISWKYLNTNPVTNRDYFRVKVSTNLSSIPTGNVTFTTSISMNDFSVGTMFLPEGLEGDDFFTGYVLYNQDVSILNNQPSYRTIISYDGSSKLLGFDLNSGSVTTGNAWLTSHTYTIRKTAPNYIGVLPAPTILPTPPPLLLPYQGPNTNRSFAVPSNINISIGDFIRFTSGNLINKTYRIVNYTKNGISENLSANPPIIYTPPNVVTVNPSLDIVPTTGWNFEVLHFSKDNLNPLCYSGSLVSQQEMVCYEIELINLIIPNKTLVSGGLTSYYPHFYVELSNISSTGSGAKNLIYSNNPNSRKMLFRATIDDIVDTTECPFIKIDGDGMVQTVKFKPNDNLTFGVYLPNGDLLQTVKEDNFSPSEPNKYLQISAIFSIKRL